MTVTLYEVIIGEYAELDHDPSGSIRGETQMVGIKGIACRKL